MNKLYELVGKSHKFEDGDSITVIQIKSRSFELEDHLVTFLIQQGPGIPRKLVMNYVEFTGTYGHLFNLTIDN